MTQPPPTPAEKLRFFLSFEDILIYVHDSTGTYSVLTSKANHPPAIDSVQDITSLVARALELRLTKRERISVPGTGFHKADSIHEGMVALYPPLKLNSFILE